MGLSRTEISRLRGVARHRRDRHAAGRFVVEGEKLVREVLASDLTVHQVLVAEGWRGIQGKDDFLAMQVGPSPLVESLGLGA